jgi:phosphatidylglycerophosphate synthase
VFRIPPKARLPLRLLAVLMSAGLFAYLVWQVGPAKLWENVATLGWGFTLVLALAGVSHVARTRAWQLTLGDDKHKISFPRMLGLRLGAEAAGQLGILGQTFGDSIRVSRLSAEMPIASGLASVTLDRGLYIVTGTMITIAGILAALPVLSISHALRLYAGLFVLTLITFLLLTLLAVRKRWPVISGSARIIGRVPSFKNWMEKRYLLIQSVENTLLDFHHNTPKAFWTSFSLNLASHCIAVLEVCLILWLMGVKIGFFRALVIEGLTKLVNVMGNFNPGNFGTYEGGNMLIGKMFGMNGATGLALGLSRRLRSFFWAAVGVICLVLLTKPGKRRRDSENPGSTPASVAQDPTALADPLSNLPPVGEVAVAIFLPSGGANSSQFRSPLARVGSLPILLRTILAAQKAGPTRIMVVVDPITRPIVQRELFCTKRLPESVQWIEAAAGASLSQLLRLAATQAGSQRLVLIDGNTTYHPSLLQKAGEWNDEGVALALTSGNKPVGIHALTVEMVRDFADRCPTQVGNLEEVHAWLTAMHSVVCMPVPENLWQRVSTLEDCRFAERKLDCWLVKPTDGIYARMNRRISIPISRQLIKFPITPNMVSIFTLGVGFASAAFFAYGGYWNTLLGAFLCLWASILDGCDGEVARLKLQESDFGCWLETICDYLFYLFLFVGMTIGLWRSSGTRAYLVWGGLLLFGAIATFLATGWERHRLAAGRPEQLLKIWQGHAESRPSNPFLYFSRHTEFIIRRCFFPYALLFFALFNIMNVAFVLSAIGANLAWPIALYSSRTFAGARSSPVASPAAST